MVVFWEAPQGAAIFKHAVLRQYAPVFAGKVGSRSQSHRVEIVDGYAGQGWYDNGEPGSPAVLLSTAEMLKDIRDVHCWFIEEDRSTSMSMLRVADAAGDRCAGSSR